tara:strand:- start:53062 stop:53364 length:303 start_codon:yes stop_codon:yes gene_type:complete
MNINFEYHNANSSRRLEAIATEKIKKLINKYDFIVGTDVYFKGENTSSDSTGKICEFRINIPGSTVFSEANKGSFEAALSETVKQVKMQLQKKKEKMQIH